MKKITVIIISIIIFILSGNILGKEVCYQYSIKMIKNGEYKKAMFFLDEFNDFFGYDSLFNMNLIYIDKPKRFYRNSKYLFLYAEAKDDMEMEFPSSAWYYIKDIYDNYDGELCDEIKVDKEEIKTAYDEYVEEAVEYYKSKPDFKNEYPYYAMYEGLIDCTILGPSDKHVTEGKITTYYWYGNPYVEIECADGYVNKVTPYSMSREGQRAIAQKEEEERQKRIEEQKKNTKTYSYSGNNDWINDDGYGVNEYDDPEEFYYDWYDEFEDYDDAEDYYYEYKDR